MPYGGVSAIGLTNLLDEVSMPHVINTAYNLFTPDYSSFSSGILTASKLIHTISLYLSAFIGEVDRKPFVQRRQHEQR